MKCIVNIDGAGYSRNLDVYTHRFESIGNTFVEVADELAIPIAIADDIRPHSDHWPFVQKGVPGVQVRSTSTESGRGWGHTYGDTLDKLDVRDIRDLTVALATGVVKLAERRCKIEPKPVSEIREATIEDGHEKGMRNAGSWPFEREQ